uniref:Uncharacterized protein n=1 Tax=Glossina brevipalpis TaxID=37001 RepID=A0A1A9WSM4_9MUSC
NITNVTITITTIITIITTTTTNTTTTTITTTITTTTTTTTTITTNTTSTTTTTTITNTTTTTTTTSITNTTTTTTTTNNNNRNLAIVVIENLKMLIAIKYFNYFIISLTFILNINAVTRQQFEQSLVMMRNGCAPKFKLTTEQIDGLMLHEMHSSASRNGELSVSKALAQIPMILPPDMQDIAKASLEACKDVQKDYKDSCDRLFFITKCVYEFSPSDFVFP